MLDLAPPTIMLMDIETSGLYRKDLSIDDPGQPWAMSVGAALCNASGQFTSFFHHIIKADGRTAKDGATAVHGIGLRATSQIGIPEPRVLGTLIDMLKTSPMDEELKVVSYGDFDGIVLSSLFARYAASQGKPSTTYDRQFLRRPLKQFVNLMLPVAQMVCKIPSQFEDSAEYKWPTLDEACQIVLGMPPRPGLHDAWDDMLRLKQLYFEFRRRGYFFDQPAQAATQGVST